MSGIPREVIEHKLGIDPSVKPIGMTPFDRKLIGIFRMGSSDK
jgi:hypothetical protein